MKTKNSVLELIGNTPLLRLNKITKDLNTDVLAKCEHMNPSGSVKDRMVLGIIEQAEKEKKLKPGSIIVESTSGNTGIAMALVGAAKGYKVRLRMSRKSGPLAYSLEERKKIMKSFGAEVEEYYLPLEDIKDVPDDFKRKVQLIKTYSENYKLEKSDPRVWWANQMRNPYHVVAYEKTLGKEIVEQTDGKVDAWVASIGSAASLLGVARVLRRTNPSVRIVAVEPADNPVMKWAKESHRFDKYYKEFGVPKTKTIVDTMVEEGLPDEVITVRDEDARNMANRLCQEEGLFCGMSSGANVLAAIEIAKRMRKGGNVVTLLVDRRDRYLGEYPKERYIV